MRGMFGRFLNMVKAKVHRAMDEAADPAERLDYSYDMQMEMLQHVRRGIADVATSKARVQRQLAHLHDQTAGLDGQARQALTLGREDMARTALTRKATIESQARALAVQVADLDVQQNRLREGEGRLSAKIQAFRAYKEALKAQYRAAQARARISDAATGLTAEMSDVPLGVQRAQDKTERMQARAAALEELAGGAALPEIGPGNGDDIDRGLARLAAGDDVQRPLEATKRALPEAPQAPKQVQSTDRAINGDLASGDSAPTGERD
jgi:phage shock protein A